MEVKEPKKEEAKITDPTIVASILIDLYSNGDRDIHVQNKDEKVQIPLTIIRETLNWAKDKVNDKMQDYVLQAQLKSFMQEKVIKPGFRPMNVAKRIFGIK